MKKIITSILAVTLVAARMPLAAQDTFTITEFQQLCDLSSSDFETYVLKKGFSLNKNEIYDDGSISTMYFSDERRQYDTPDMLTRISGTTVTMVCLSTTGKDYYLTLKNQLASSGYIFEKEYQKDISGKMCQAYDYSYNGYHVTLYSDTINGITWYTLQIGILK